MTALQVLQVLGGTGRGTNGEARSFPSFCPLKKNTDLTDVTKRQICATLGALDLDPSPTGVLSLRPEKVKAREVRPAAG